MGFRKLGCDGERSGKEPDENLRAAFGMVAYGGALL
jgi:hypothetical protein